MSTINKKTNQQTTSSGYFDLFADPTDKLISLSEQVFKLLGGLSYNEANVVISLVNQSIGSRSIVTTNEFEGKELDGSTSIPA